MLQSFIVYSLFAIILFIIARNVTENQVLAVESRGRFSMPSNYWWCVFVFALIAGMRYDVGVDHLSYLSDYLDALNGNFQARDRGYEEAYMFITIMFGKLGIHPTLYFGFLAALQIGMVLLAFRSERFMVPWMLMFIVLGGPFFTWMNGIRQMTAAAIIVFSAQFIQEKKLIPFIISIAVAYLWHHSAIILLPLFLLGFDKSKWTSTKLNFIIFGACFIVGMTPTWVSHLSDLGNMLSYLGYDMYAERIESLTDGSEFRSFDFGPRMICMLSTYIIVIMVYPRVREYFNNDKVDFIYKLFMIAVCSYYLFVNTSMYFLRPVLYFTIFIAPAVGYTLAYLCGKRKILLIVLLVLSMSYTYLSCMSDASKPITQRGSYLYEFYFDHTIK